MTLAMRAPLAKVTTLLYYLTRYICYAQLIDHKHTRFYYEKGDYCNIGEHMDHAV